MYRDLDADGDAPNFGPSRYPGEGRRIGPAWRAMWRALSDGAWHTSDELARAGIGVQDTPEAISWSTAKGLLNSAARAGVLEQRYSVPPGRRRVSYRRPA